MSDLGYRRGDLLLIDLPFADVTQSKVRPALLVQNDVANKVSGNLIVVSISSRVPQRLLPTQYKVTAGSPLAQAAGLLRDSVVDCSVIYTLESGEKPVFLQSVGPALHKGRLLGRESPLIGPENGFLGAFPPPVMSEIDARLKISLALT